MRGTVKFYNATKGFGFIIDEGDKDVFFHKSGLGKTRVNEGDKVEFDTQPGKKGLNAVNIKRV